MNAVRSGSSAISVAVGSYSVSAAVSRGGAFSAASDVYGQSASEAVGISGALSSDKASFPESSAIRTSVALILAVVPKLILMYGMW